MTEIVHDGESNQACYFLLFYLPRSLFQLVPGFFGRIKEKWSAGGPVGWRPSDIHVIDRSFGYDITTLGNFAMLRFIAPRATRYRYFTRKRFEFCIADKKGTVRMGVPIPVARFISSWFTNLSNFGIRGHRALVNDQSNTISNWIFSVWTRFRKVLISYYFIKVSFFFFWAFPMFLSALLINVLRILLFHLERQIRWGNWNFP